MMIRLYKYTVMIDLHILAQPKQLISLHLCLCLPTEMMRTQEVNSGVSPNSELALASIWVREGWIMNFGIREHDRFWRDNKRVYNVHQPTLRLKTWCCEPHKVLLFVILSSFFVFLSSLIILLYLLFFLWSLSVFLLFSPDLHFSPAMTGKLP